MNLHLQQLVHQLVCGMEFWVLLALAQHWCVGGIGSGVSTISDASNNVLAGTDVMIRAGCLYTLNGSKRHESDHRALTSTASALSGRLECLARTARLSAHVHALAVQGNHRQ